MKTLLLFFLSLGVLDLLGQGVNCESQVFFEKNTACSSDLRGFKCIELDISHTVDKEGKEFIYAWNFGDGTVKNGYLTEYCYENFGTYTISLDLVDPKTKMVIRNELTRVVTLLPPVDYLTDSVKQLNVAFQYDRSMIPGVLVEKVFWKVENTYHCGNSTSHTFINRGFHLIEVGVVGTQDGKNVSGCTLMGIFIGKEK